MIYLVSGYMRTGTSMMMQALIRGGMEGVINKERDDEIIANYNAIPDIPHINPNGLKELSPQQTEMVMLNPHKFDGKLFKVLAGGLPRLAAWQWKIIYMERPRDDILASARKTLIPDDALEIRKKLVVEDAQMFANLTNYTQGILHMRMDVEMTKVQYNNVLDNPVKEFTRIKDEGWPIDPEKAASIVDPKRCRNRAA